MTVRSNTSAAPVSSANDVRLVLLVVFLFFAFRMWWHHTTAKSRVVAIIASSLFSLMETMWTGIGSIVKSKRKICPWPGHTTVAQWWCNILWTPVLLFFYRECVPNAFLRVLLFPLNIWMLEIVEGYAMMLLFGRNMAWNYDECPDAMFNGNIRLAYALPWWALGFAVEAIWKPLLGALEESLWFAEPALAVNSLLIAVAASYILPKYIGWPLLALPLRASRKGSAEI